MPLLGASACVWRDGHVLMIQRAKPPVTGQWSLPGGHVEPGEAVIDAAHRELLEETGHEAAEWHELGEFAVDGNRGAGRGYAFLARGARPVRPATAEDLEEQHLVSLTRPELEVALDGGEFKVMPWVATIALALRRLDSLQRGRSAL